MKLNSEQIDLINRYLEQRNLDFLDFKLEVSDHIATSVETIMQERKLDFESAFTVASQPWEIALKEKKLWIISNERLFPEMVVKQIKKSVLLHYFIVLLLSLGLGIVLQYFFANLFENATSFFKPLVICIAVVTFVLRRIVAQKKIVTSYSFHLNYFNIPLFVIFFFLIVQINTTYFEYLFLLVVVDFPFAIYYFLKHKQFITKHQLL